MSSKSSRNRSAFLIGGVVIAADQLSKAWMVANLDPHIPRQLIGDTLALQLGFNEGAAFSLFGGGGFTAVLAAVAVGVSVMLVRMLRTSTDRWTTFGLALVLGGAIGNLIDRIFRSPGVFRGHVVDFIAVRHIPYFDRWPIFNIADMGIVIGVGILLIMSFTSENRSSQQAPPEADTAGDQPSG